MTKLTRLPFKPRHSVPPQRLLPTFLNHPSYPVPTDCYLLTCEHILLTGHLENRFGLREKCFQALSTLVSGPQPRSLFPCLFLALFTLFSFYIFMYSILLFLLPPCLSEAYLLFHIRVKSIVRVCWAAWEENDRIRESLQWKKSSVCKEAWSWVRAKRIPKAIWYVSNLMSLWSVRRWDQGARQRECYERPFYCTSRFSVSVCVRFIWATNSLAPTLEILSPNCKESRVCDAGSWDTRKPGESRVWKALMSCWSFNFC